jgi:ribosomal-protein-alanine N-acetyltransferase
MTTTKRIQLRAKKLSDAREDYEWQTDPELCRLDAADILNMSYKNYIAEYTFEMCYPTSNRHEFSVDTLDGLHIGNCVYYNVNKIESKAEIGIMIGNRDYWNQGYGTEIVNTLLNYVFDKTGLKKAYLTTLVWNARAHKCFKKCGFSENGELMRDGYRFTVMVVDRGEWERLRKAADEADNIPIKPTMN